MHADSGQITQLQNQWHTYNIHTPHKYTSVNIVPVPRHTQAQHIPNQAASCFLKIKDVSGIKKRTRDSVIYCTTFVSHSQLMLT